MTAHSQPTYGKILLIWTCLLALLAAGTFTVSLPISKTGAVGLILGIALVKAALVGLFYMHLKYEEPVPLWMVAIFPFILVGLAVLLVVLGLAFA